MPRLHLFEWEDQAWFPSFLRDYMTDFLQFLANKTGMFNPVLPLITEALKQNKTHTIIDLASGGGGGLLGLNEALKKEIPDLNIVLTDFYPNLPAFERAKAQANNLDFSAVPIDARAVPPDLRGLRTQFLSLHHFKPADARLILQNAVDSAAPIAIFEGQERSFSSIFAMLFSPITVLLLTPFIRPFKWGRLLFTYLIPILPLLVLWDGVVSSLRTYSVAEMKDLITQVKGAEQYDWQVGKLKSGPSKLLYLVGMPKKR